MVGIDPSHSVTLNNNLGIRINPDVSSPTETKSSLSGSANPLRNLSDERIIEVLSRLGDSANPPEGPVTLELIRKMVIDTQCGNSFEEDTISKLSTPKCPCCRGHLEGKLVTPTEFVAAAKKRLKGTNNTDVGKTAASIVDSLYGDECSAASAASAASAVVDDAVTAGLMASIIVDKAITAGKRAAIITAAEKNITSDKKDLITCGIEDGDVTALCSDTSVQGSPTPDPFSRFEFPSLNSPLLNFPMNSSTNRYGIVDSVLTPPQTMFRTLMSSTRITTLMNVVGLLMESSASLRQINTPRISTPPPTIPSTPPPTIRISTPPPTIPSTPPPTRPSTMPMPEIHTPLPWPNIEGIIDSIPGTIDTQLYRGNYTHLSIS